MQRAVILTVLIGVAVLLGGIFVIGSRNDPNYAMVWGTPTPTSAERIYQKPEIGIPFTQFQNVCSKAFDGFKSANGDSMATTESSRSSTATVTFTSTDERIRSGCYGTFSFIDGKLERISR